LKGLTVRKMIVMALLALAVPAAALAADDTPSATDVASAACKSERAQSGTKTFKATYASNSTSAAMAACVGKRDGAAATDLENAAKACKAERAADLAAFTTKYGTNENGKNAYGKCVSAKAREAAAQETQARVNAAKTCKAERTADAAAFTTKYGTNKNGKNAFGKCVSKQAKAG
jgi:hypothetical protein